VRSIGYILTDENFNIIKEEDIFFKQEKCEQYPYINSNFTDYYTYLKEMFTSNEVLVFGWSVSGDLRTLNHEYLALGLKPIFFECYDLQEIFNQKLGSKPSLSKANEILGVDTSNIKAHISVNDAKMTMFVLRELVKMLNTNVNTLINEFKKKIDVINVYQETSKKFNHQLLKESWDFVQQNMKKSKVSVINKENNLIKTIDTNNANNDSIIVYKPRFNKHYLKSKSGLITIKEFNTTNKKVKIYLPKTIVKQIRDIYVEKSSSDIQIPLEQIISKLYNTLPNNILDKITNPKTCNCNYNTVGIMIDTLINNEGQNQVLQAQLD